MNKPTDQTANDTKPPCNPKTDKPKDALRKPKMRERTRFTAREWARIEATRAVLEILPNESLPL